MRKNINFREIGGYKTKDGRMIPFKTFYRSGSLSRMNKEEIEEFLSHNIKYILDLRTKKETDIYPDPIFEGIEYLRHSGVESEGGKEIDFSPKGMRQIGKEGKMQYDKLLYYYQNMAFNNEAFHIMFEYIINKKTPIIIHCASGKDRTGIAMILLMLFLGVSEEDALDNYLLSNIYCKKDIEKEKEKAKAYVKDDIIAQKLSMMMPGVIIDMALTTLNSIKEKYKSYEDYFIDEYKINKEDIMNVRDYYLIKSNI